MFPPHQQAQIRQQLAAVLKAAIAQRLLPTADGSRRVPAVEVLVATPYIRDCIADPQKTDLITNALAHGTSQYGTQTFDQSIFGLYSAGIVTLDEALRWTSNPDEFKLKVQGVSEHCGSDAPSIRTIQQLRTSQALDCYTAALTLLLPTRTFDSTASRSTGRRKFSADEIEPVIARLTQDGTLDDRRVARASARLGAVIKRRGRRRVLQEVKQLGIGAATAKEAVDDVFAEVDEIALLDRAIERRLKGVAAADLDRQGRARVVRSLVGQGFDACAGLRSSSGQGRRTRRVK